MNKNWKIIWADKTLKDLNLDKDEFSVFCDLKRANGFDVNVKDEQLYFRSFYNDWMIMYENLNNMAYKNIRSVYEVGCGSGVNLYLFKNRINNVTLGGIDYSQGLIDIAKKVVESDDLVCGNAENMDINTKYDCVIADSVFQYFGSLEYAENILTKMIQKSEKLVYISELHDIDLREEWLEHRRNSMENYDQIYEGLDKLFYSRKWIRDIAEKNDRQAIFSGMENPEYWNSRYVFSCYIF